MAALTPRAALPWQQVAPGLLLIAAVLLLFRETATAMVGIWTRSETFTHAFLVPPITLWLIWRRRERLAQIPRQPMPLLLLPIAAVCGLWLLGELASVNAATQFALVCLVVLAVPAVFGWAVARELTFPLLFLFFAVPVGEFMVPPMMEWTADFTVKALQLTGIPVYREGLQFVIPSGNWSVVEACSGVRYLIASFMVGTLFAYLNYRSSKRRVIFMLVSLAVPIVANWLRAYLIVMVGHLSDNKLAAGVDHLVYGWVFFGVVIGVMFLIGARWSEPDDLDEAVVQPVRAGGSGAPGAVSAAPVATRSWAMAAAVLVVMGATQALFWQLDRPREGPPLALKLPAGAGGWVAAEASAEPATGLPPYTPAWQNASATASQRYASAADPATAVTTWVGYYRDTGYDRKLVTSTNALVEGTLEAPWAQVDAGGTQAQAGAGTLALRTATLRSNQAGGVGRLGAPRLRVWQLYWIGGTLTTSDARAKVHLAINRLLGRGDDGAVLILHTPVADNPEGLSAAEARLAAFARENLQPLLATLAAAKDRK
jgi:exosortase A